jgi:hypothetical protein
VVEVGAVVACEGTATWPGAAPETDMSACEMSPATACAGSMWLSAAGAAPSIAIAGEAVAVAGGGLLAAEALATVLET